MGISKEEWKNKTAVFTAVITDFEHLGPQIFEDGVDYYYFTDGTSMPLHERWNVVVLDKFSHIHPRRISKFVKHVPHMFPELQKYKYTVWIDGDMQIIKPNFVEEIMFFLDNGMVLSPHFDVRNCAYTEATIRPAKYQTEPMDAQVEYYQQRGFPENYGLYETGVMARDMTDPRVKELGMRWFIHNMVLSYQDQVSLPFCLWDMQYQPAVLPMTFRNFGWVIINAHKHEG
jgi:hypothetical protein